ncbi:MAG: DUF2786 domain-containing protein [Desulfuromonadaceae bacterium]
MNDKTAPIIEKIKKLLALASSSNEHEAALAAGHAQRLLSEHNLAMADIDATHKPDKADKVETVVPKTLPKWLRHLSSSVSTSFDCQTVHYPATGKMVFIGVGADVEIASYTFSYLHRVVRKLCTNYVRHHVDDRITGRNRELLKQSYLLGAASTIALRLREQKIQTPITSTALVPVKEGLIKQTMSELGKLRTVRSRKSYINAEAYGKGQNDGRQVGINKGIAGHSQSHSKLT